MASSSVLIIFALVVFACILNECYPRSGGDKEICIFNNNDDACRYGVGIGVLAFLACIIFFVVDLYFPQISNTTDRKYIVIADLGFSGLWTFLWFVGFCFLTNQWVNTTLVSEAGKDGARAAIAFSFFSIFSWGLLTMSNWKRYKMGIEDPLKDYTDPSHGSSAPYSYPTVASSTYQQSPFSNPATGSESYQPPPVY
ncbi:synaptogyrin-2 isoform X2 [Protopterus annectens]|uniref:synaptogyrin-2 isoform X2 n=1 Tax=Protopterus annectens TaxID=7888 RepID=UPI001CFAC6B6|nr:synaptogyrin-2 isoform X2 [Protopterus annectens]